MVSSVMQSLLTLLTFFFHTILLLHLLVHLLLKILSNRTSTKKTTKEDGLFFTQLPPGPKPWPLVGSLVTLYFNKPAFRWILAAAEGRSVACIRLGDVHVIPVNCPAMAREFLQKHDAVFASRPVTVATEHSSRGFRSLVVSPLGDHWKKMRRTLASEVLSRRRLQCQRDLRAQEADHIVRYIYIQCLSRLSAPGPESGAVIDVRSATRHYCGNVIRRMVFGRRNFGGGGENGGPGAEEVEHVEAAFAVLSLIYSFCVSDYLPWLRWMDLEGHERLIRKAVGVVNKHHDPIIDERIEMRRGTTAGRGERCTEKQASSPDQDILDVLISLQDSNGEPLLTTEEIKAQSAELVYATVDNPSNTVEWAIAEMLNQPEILKKAVEELDRVVGKERLVQEEDFPQLTYVRTCAREALRLHPIAPFNLPHVSTSDAVVGGYFIPKGSHVLLSRVGLGRNPKVWDDPLRFDPDRHLTSDWSTPVELAESELRFISFSTGRRGCMGAPLGTAMTYMLLARLLQGFTWALPPGIEAVDISEEKGSLFLRRPLHAVATPRLPLLQNL